MKVFSSTLNGVENLITTSHSLSATCDSITPIMSYNSSKGLTKRTLKRQDKSRVHKQKTAIKKAVEAKVKWPRHGRISLKSIANRQQLQGSRKIETEF